MTALGSESVVVIIYFMQLDSAVPMNVVSCFAVHSSTNNIYFTYDIGLFKDKEIKRNCPTEQHKK